MAARSSAPEGNKDTPTRTANRENAQQATQARRSVQDAGNSRLAENVSSDQTVPEQVYADYALNYDEDDAALNGKIPDVLLDAPMVSIKGLDFELDDLRAKVSLFAKVLELVELSAGIDAYLGKVKLTIESVDVQALLKVRLDNVTAILDRVLTTIDRNPQIVQELTSGVGSAVEDVGKGPVSWWAKEPTRPSPTSAQGRARRWKTSERELAGPSRTSAAARARQPARLDKAPDRSPSR